MDENDFRPEELAEKAEAAEEKAEELVSEALDNALWKVNLAHNINYFYKDVLEIQIPFDDLKIKSGEGIYMIFVSCRANIVNQVLPLDNAIYIQRP